MIPVITKSEKIKMLKRKKRPVCTRCGQPIWTIEFQYVKTKGRGEVFYHNECFVLEWCGNGKDRGQ